MEDIQIRPTVKEDRKKIIEWLNNKETLRWYPMTTEKELEFSTSIWMNYIPKKSVITADYKGVPVGAALLYVQEVKKLSHHALFAIIVDKNHRGKGIGTRLLQEIIDLSKNRFNIEILLLEVYEGNPAIRLYRRFDFKQYAVHQKFLKEDGKYYSKIMMQKYL